MTAKQRLLQYIEALPDDLDENALQACLSSYFQDLIADIPLPETVQQYLDESG